jgi:hypothetical protein
MRRRMILFGVLATLALSAMSAASAAAAGAHKPDGWVRYGGLHDTPDDIDYPDPGALKGKNIYNTTALHQTATHTGPATGPNGYHYFTVTIQNDGASDRFKVKGGGTYAKYFNGSTNITSQVKAGTYQTASLAAGAKTTITVRLNWGGPALVTITSVADPTKKDAVKVVLKEDGTCFC